ncbi:MAG: hypothetical protein Harvfovirus15_10 [Harvfovirus sp.]|uniref:Uncharacterized protein n=1 Tax=Harvfovirus sp. TaxID=2487768 RepID=A0A3G5A1G0_9VIRU|nr:MAG: hypothetical protein Harvfovirus15_10 [Harvfovirus sp.]
MVITTKILIVYFAYLNKAKAWWEIILGQLIELKDSGLLNHGKLYVCLTGASPAIAMAKVLINSLLTAVEIQTSEENRYEYPGISLVWNLANQPTLDPDTKILYFHSKGMFSGPKIGRCFVEKYLTKTVVLDYEDVLKIFDDSNVNKIGVGASARGYIWFNFWWVRASFVKNCEKPKVSNHNRYYFETWLGTHREQKTAADCFSLVSNRTNDFYTTTQMIKIMEQKRYLKYCASSQTVIALYGYSDKYKDVSDILRENFLKHDKIVLPEGSEFNKFFNDVSSANVKNLIVCVGNQIFTMNEKSNATAIELS